jgi:hypothetical protein
MDLAADGITSRAITFAMMAARKKMRGEKVN